MADRKLDLFQLLDKISTKDGFYFHTLADDQLKEFQPFVIMRWLTGTFDKRQVYFLNAIVNPFVFDIGQHKELLYYLLTTCTAGKSQRYVWTKAPSQNRKGKLTVSVLTQKYNYGKREAAEAAAILSAADIIEYAEDLGWQKEEIVKLKKELKND